ncbi:mitochondrial metal transporter [Tilletia horrida]|nr:mitochondrial metal transporter [Tilletia horrida]
MSAQLSQRKDGTAIPAKELNGSSSAHDHHSHSHSHSLNPFAAHSHSHGHAHAHDHGSAEEADALLAALKGRGDRGSNITLLGLASNVVLCASKGVAGVYLNSAALLADAAHSLSDMFSDLVTLFCWKMSQLPASESHPLGYGKYETMGSLGVSLVLVAGSLGIGFHSYGLLLEALQPTLAHAPHAIQVLSSWSGSVASVGAHLHDHAGEAGHGHSHGAGGADGTGLLDPNAMWFALLSVIVKEWLYHATLKIAREENSSVLEANAIHHRSDSLSSGVTFLAIGGSWLGFPVLDPLGGLLVAGLIGKQGAELLLSALGELSDRGVERETLDTFRGVLDAATSSEGGVQGWHSLRAIKSGVSIFVDVHLVMPPQTTLEQAHGVELAVVERLKESRKGVKEVRVQFSTEFPSSAAVGKADAKRAGNGVAGKGKAE